MLTWVALSAVANSCNLFYLPCSNMTKYILVSGGVVSGIGKGVIGTTCQTIPFSPIVQAISSILHRSFVENDRLEGHCYQNRPVHEHRCRNYETPGAWWERFQFLSKVALKQAYYDQAKYTF